MATPQASSRLELLQARFQQKQLQEKEQKLLQLYDQQQQRAYQVVQRGSAGSNGSNHGSSISHHTVTKTTTTSHTTSTSQGGKVRQMFDERRQTTVKGIDRSYPLEPLENKPRKQANGNVVQKNGNSTVNRQSVTVKRVARADVNSNLNGGKPIVSYHEEITRESYGPDGRQQPDDDEFGNENHITQYANGNQTHIEEVLDEDTIERNRMMAKLHLMEYDETLKHRVKNDLESEEFPEDFMVDIPDKLPKRTVTKKLSQAEARLERFKNANAKRSNSITKNPSTVLKKRSDPILPAKSTSSEDEGEARIRVILDRASSGGSPRKIQSSATENVADRTLSLDSETKLKRKNESSRSFRKETKASMGLKVDEELKDRIQRSGSPKFFCKESEKSATNYAMDSKIKEKLSTDFSKNIRRRSESPEFLDSKNARKLDQMSKDRAKRSESPKFFCKETEKSATTHAIDSKARGKLSPEFSKNIQRTESSKFASKTGKRLSDQWSKDITKRSDSPKFFCKETEKSATTYAIDSKTREKLSPELSKNIPQRSKSPEFSDSQSARKSSDQLLKNRTKRSESPKFFCKETEKSATTYAIDSKTREKLSPELSKNIPQRNRSPEFSDSQSARKSSDQLLKDRTKRSESPKFFCKETEKSATTYAIDSKTREKLSPEFSKSIRRSESPEFVNFKISRKSNETLKDRTKRSESPKFFCKETEKSATTYSIDSKTREKLSPEFSKNIPQRSGSPEFSDSQSARKSSNEMSKDRTKRSGSPKFFCKETEKSATTYAIDSKTRKKLSSEISKDIKKRSDSPKFYCKESEKSATTYAIDSRSRSTSPDFIKIESRDVENVPVTNIPMDVEIIDRKVSRKSEKIDRTSPRNDQRKDSKPTRNKVLNVFDRLTRERSSPKLSRTPTSAAKDSKFLQKRDKNSEIIRGTKSKSPNITKKFGRSSTSPQFFSSDSERSATIMLVTPETLLKSKPESSRSEKRKQDSKSYKSNSIIGEPGRRMSEEIVDASSKRNIRSSVSRFFSEQCERVSRNLRDDVQSAGTDKSLPWSRSSSPLSLKDMRTPSPTCPRFSRAKTEKSVSTTAIDGSRDLFKSPRNSRSASPRSKSSKEASMKRTSKSKSPDSFKIPSLRSTKLIRDALQHRTNAGESRRNSRMSIEADEVRELPSSKSSPKSCTSVEVDAEIQEITMPDQYIEHRPLQGDKARRGSSTEKLFTYSVGEPGGERGSLFELSKADQGKTDRQGASGREERAGRNAKSSPSPTDSSALRGSKLRTRENKKRIETESLRDKRFIDEHGNSRGTKGRNSSPANNLIICDSRRQQILDEHNQERKRSKSNSPSPTNNFIFRGSKRVAKEDKSKSSQKTILNEERSKRIRNTRSDSTVLASKRRLTEATNRRNEVRKKTPSPVQTKQKKASSRSPQILRSTKLVQSAIKGSFEKSREVIDETRTFQAEVNRSDSIESRRSSSTFVCMKEESSSRKNHERDSVELFDFASLEESKAISLRDLDPSVVSLKMNENESKTQGRFARTRDSIEIARIAIESKSPVCKRKLFQEADSGDETETGSSKSRYSLDSTGGEKESKSKAEEIDGNSVSVKQLRSIEDIRKSIDSRLDAKGTKSAIANDASKRSNETRSRRTSPDDRAGYRKDISVNLAATKHALGDAERSSIKCAMRFFRVTKSPSPDSTKTTEPGNRARRNVLSSPSKSPDIVTRRPSNELKAQEARTSKRPTLMKGTEPIGNRKTMTTTSTRKSTDVVDGAILENGVHLRDQTAETKYDNDPIATKKSDAFVIDFDEQPPKENDAPIPRKSLLRKQSIDKQTPSTQTGRTPSSISSTSSGSSMQGQVSGSKGKMTSKAKTSSSGVSHKGSSSSKNGGCANVADALIPCKMCGRRFAQDRVAYHEQICAKTAQKKRKQFDSVMYRIKGTDLEPFVKRGLNKKQPERLKKPEPKSNWRRKHEDFINAIRSAKQVQAHLAAGGKLSDLPPPPPCDTSDYIQCPHCGRKFNQSAAQRHIPKCETMLHNKPIHSRAPKPKR